MTSREQAVLPQPDARLFGKSALNMTIALAGAAVALLLIALM